MIENNMLFYGKVLKQLLQAYDDSVSLELMKEFEKALKDESFGYVSQIVEVNEATGIRKNRL